MIHFNSPVQLKGAATNDNNDTVTQVGNKSLKLQYLFGRENKCKP